MALTAAQICRIAGIRAKVPGFTDDQAACLNLSLRWFSQQYDFEINKAPFNFQFIAGTTPIGNLQAQLASGPFWLPADYLRTKRGDIQFYPVPGYPFQLTPIDLEEFDHQWQQAGFQNYPVFFVTDTSLRRDVLTTTATTVAGNGVIAAIPSTAGLTVGMGLYGDPIRISSVAKITAVAPNQVTIDTPADVILSGTNVSITFGTQPIAYVWPPAGGAYPCFLRYYRKPPDIANAAYSAQIPWFEFQDALLDAVTGRLMHESDDSRALQFLGEGEPNSVPTQMRKILQMADDRNNRARRVNLDRRRFGPSHSTLPKSKATFGF